MYALYVSLFGFRARAAIAIVLLCLSPCLLSLFPSAYLSASARPNFLLGIINLFVSQVEWVVCCVMYSMTGRMGLLFFYFNEIYTRNVTSVCGALSSHCSTYTPRIGAQCAQSCQENCAAVGADQNDRKMMQKTLMMMTMIMKCHIQSYMVRYYEYLWFVQWGPNRRLPKCQNTLDRQTNNFKCCWQPAIVSTKAIVNVSVCVLCG